MPVHLAFGLGQQLRGNKSVNSLTKLSFVVEVKEIVHELVRVLLEVLVRKLLFPNLVDPFVLEGLLCCRPLVGFISQ